MMAHIMDTHKLDASVRFMLACGFTVKEVFKVLGLKTLKVEMSKPEMEFEVTDHGNGELCSSDNLCGFCKDSFLAVYGEVLLEGV